MGIKTHCNTFFTLPLDLKHTPASKDISEKAYLA